MTVEFHLGKCVTKIFQIIHLPNACVFSVSYRNFAPGLLSPDWMKILRVRTLRQAQGGALRLVQCDVLNLHPFRFVLPLRVAGKGKSG